MMASSKVMSTTSPTNPDMPRQPSLCSSLSTLLSDLQNNHRQQPYDDDNNKADSSSQNLGGSMSMDDLLNNIYASPTPPTTADPHAPQFSGASISREGSFSLPKEVANKSVDEVWKELVSGSDHQREDGSSGGARVQAHAHAQALEEMTLEDFLTKAGAVREEDVRGVVQVGMGAAGYGVDAGINGSQYQGFGNNINGGAVVDLDHQRVMGPAGGGRGKRRAVEEPPLDKATQQKQRRMIKNRESAARSRERKQAYTVELESLVTQLEEENARLLKEEAEQNKQRFNQLMENLIPVEEKRQPRRVLRRVNSLHW